jgi:lantibiotic modifying enzyme
MHWTALLDGSFAEQAEEAVMAIASDMETPAPPDWKWGWEREFPDSLGFGNAGTALFYCCLARVLRNSRYAETALTFLNQALSGLGQEYGSPGFLTGASGICWASEHIMACLYPKTQRIDRPGESEQEILERCHTTTDTSAAFMDGFGGMCVYAAERMPRHSAASLLRFLADRLQEMAESVVDGVAWKLSRRAECDFRSFAPEFAPSAEAFPTCVGYGQAGIIGGLLAAHMSQSADTQVEHLLERAVSWIFGQRSSQTTGPCFPPLVGANLSSLPNGWMTGDLGIIPILYRAGAHMGNQQWQDAALEMARVDARKRLRHFRIRDGNYSLCDGSIGRAHISNRFFHATGESLFADLARHCYVQALSHRRPGVGIGGFQSKEVDAGGFLTGAIGMGIALLASISPLEPDWDRALLASFVAKAPAGREQQTMVQLA